MVQLASFVALLSIAGFAVYAAPQPEEADLVSGTASLCLLGKCPVVDTSIIAHTGTPVGTMKVQNDSKSLQPLVFHLPGLEHFTEKSLSPNIYHRKAIQHRCPLSERCFRPAIGPEQAVSRVHRVRLQTCRADTGISGTPAAYKKSSDRLADSFGRAGFLTVFPDMFDGNPAPGDINGTPSFNLTEFLYDHRPEVTDPIIAKTITYMRKTFGVKKVAIAGYCFGGRYSFRFLADGKGGDVGFAAHPSLLEDSEVAAITQPVSVAAAGKSIPWLLVPMIWKRYVLTLLFSRD